MEYGRIYGPVTLQAEAVSRLLLPSATVVFSKLESSTAIQDAGIDAPVVVVEVVVCGPDEGDIGHTVRAGGEAQCFVQVQG